MKKCLLASVILFLTAAFSFADFNRFNIPDSTGIRKACAEAWFYDDLSDLREKRSELRKNEIGQEFQIRMEETDTSFAVIIAPQTKLEVDFYTESGIEQRTVDEYPADAKGAWVLIRNSLTGKPEKIRFFFSANSDMYIQFSPAPDAVGSGRKVFADFVIGGLFASRGVPVGISFDQLYTVSFQEILDLTEVSLPWKYANTQKGQFHSKHQMIGVIRKNLGRFVYSADSCYNENGEPVKITDGTVRKIEINGKEENKSNLLVVDQFGFLKWIVDGLVEPIAGSHLYREPLLVKTVEYNPTSLKGVINQNKNDDVSFALDWCRNLSAAILSIRTHRNYMWNEAGTDVNIEPFASEVNSKGFTQAAGYIKNSGYKISDLKPLLFVLASTEPTYCYLAAVKRPVNETANPEYFKFDQCGIIFPFYDDEGHFSCVIFDNGEELTLNQFTQKYKGSFVHLSRVLTETRFFPN